MGRRKRLSVGTKVKAIERERRDAARSKAAKKAGSDGGAATRGLSVRDKKRSAKKAKTHNQFDRRVVRSKFPVLGRRLKSAERNSGQAASRSVSIRKETLLPELRNEGRSLEFADQRFGEREDGISAEEKAMLRFRKVRQRKSAKGGAFNLNDAADDDLTHMGLALGEGGDLRDDYALLGLDREGGEYGEGHLPKAMVNASFGGGSFDAEAQAAGGGGRPKTRREIMQQIMLRSKAYKLLRQREQEAQEDATEALDADIDDLKELLAGSMRKKPSRAQKEADARIAAERAAARDGTGGGGGAAKGGGADGIGSDDDDDLAYDQLLQELKAEERVRASERSKTDAERAMEQRALLEKLERDRVRRMNGEVFDSDEDAGADDLDDDVSDSDDLATFVDADIGNGGGADANEAGTLEPAFGPGSGGDADDAPGGDPGHAANLGRLRKAQRKKEREERRKLKLEARRKRERVRKTLSVTGVAPLSKKEIARLAADAASDLPYTFPAPETYEDLTALLAGRTADETATIIQRLRACHHLALSPDNRPKLMLLLRLLMRHLTEAASPKAYSRAHLTAVTGALFELAHEFPEVAMASARDHLTKASEALSDALRNATVRPAWPRFATIVLMQALTRIFPVSDFRHPVVTPLQLHVGRALTLCPLFNNKSAVAGLALCRLMYDIVAPSARFSPEPLSFLVCLLVLLFGVADVPRLTHVQPLRSGPSLRLTPAARDVSWDGDGPIFGLDVEEVLTQRRSAELKTDAFRLQVLAAVVRLVESFSNLYSSHEYYPEAFSPFVDVMVGSAEGPLANCVPPALADYVGGVLGQIQSQVQAGITSRGPLRMYRKEVAAIRQYAPKFNEEFGATLQLDPDRERAIQRRLKKQVKHELKGAARELRKDAAFIASERERVRAEVEAERAVAVKRAYSLLESQQAEINAYDRDAKRQKR